MCVGVSVYRWQMRQADHVLNLGVALLPGWAPPIPVAAEERRQQSLVPTDAHTPGLKELNKIIATEITRIIRWSWLVLVGNIMCCLL